MGRKHNFVVIAKYLFALIILWWFFRSGYLDFSKLKPALRFQYLVPATALILLAMYFSAERMRSLLQMQKAHITSLESFRLALIGSFFNTVLPGSIGGDFIKAVYLKKLFGRDSTTSPYTVLFDRYLGLYALSLISVAALIFEANKFLDPQLMPLTVFALATFLILSVLPVIVFTPPFKRAQTVFSAKSPRRWARIFGNLLESVEVYRKSPLLIARCLLLSIICHLAAIFSFTVLGQALGVSVPAHVYLIVVPIGFILTSIPVSPGGVGVGQAAFFFLFNLYLSEKSSIGPTIVTVYQILIFAVSLLGLYYYLRFTPVDKGAS